MKYALNFFFAAAVALPLACAAAEGPSVPVARLEAENGEMRPNARGEKPDSYDKIPGVSGGKILAFFRDGKAVQYGKVPAAKWMAIAFSTDNGGKSATIQFFDGDKHLGDVEFPDTGDFHVIADVKVVRLDIPKDAKGEAHPEAVDAIERMLQGKE